MKENLIYTQAYYNLHRVIEEKEFVDFLNKSDLVWLVEPSLGNIVNELYNVISGNKVTSSKASDFILNNDTIDAKANVIISDYRSSYTLEDSKVKSKFFTNAFNKLFNRLFCDDGHNEEKHVFETYVYSWLQDNLARIIVKDVRFKPYDTIFNLLRRTERLFFFYKTFADQINPAWIKEQKDQWSKVATEKSVVFSAFDRDYFGNYKDQLKSFEHSSSWKYILDTTQFSGYVMFTDEYAIKNYILFKKDLVTWIKFWDNLELPVLQDSVFHYLQDPNYFIDIGKALVSQVGILNTNPKHLCFILLKNLFEQCLKTTEILSFYSNEDRIRALQKHEVNEIIISDGINKNNTWSEKKDKLFREVRDEILKVISVEEMSEWIFSYQPRTSSRGNYDEMYNKELEKLVGVFNQNIISVPLEEQIKIASTEFNLQKFTSLCSQVSKDKNVEYSQKILDKLFEYIQSDKFYWDETLSPAYWPSLKSMGMLISLLPNPSDSAIHFMNRFKINHEGWNLSSTDYKLMHKESFVFCGAILLLEHDEAFKDSKQRIDFFNSSLNIIMKQSRFTVVKNINDYKVPLYILYLVVNQVYLDLKEQYELEVIDNMDRIVSVIEILSNDNYALSESSLIKLRGRLDKEFGFEKRKYLQRGQANEIAKLEQAIEKLKL